MRRHESNNYLNAKTLGVALVVLLILVLIIWKPFSSKDVETNSDVESNISLDLNINSQEETDVVQTETVSTELKDRGLCEKYLFSDGDVLKIDGHKITVLGIAKDSIKVVVDDITKILSEEENDYFESGIKLGISKGGIFYYTAASEQNTVEIMVGCDYDENPNKKYLQVEGEKICKAAYESCLDTFDVEN